MARQIALQVGTNGWEHDEWLGVFYPDDLPESWRLDYFSNAFNVVLVPQQAWLSWSQWNWGLELGSDTVLKVN